MRNSKSQNKLKTLGHRPIPDSHHLRKTTEPHHLSIAEFFCYSSATLQETDSRAHALHWGSQLYLASTSQSHTLAQAPSTPEVIFKVQSPDLVAGDCLPGSLPLTTTQDTLHLTPTATPVGGGLTGAGLMPLFQAVTNRATFASWGSHLKLFSNSLEGVPRDADHLLVILPSLWGPSHPKPSPLDLGQVTVEARPSSGDYIMNLIEPHWEKCCQQSKGWLINLKYKIYLALFINFFFFFAK